MVVLRVAYEPGILVVEAG